MRIWIQKHTVAGRLPQLDHMYEQHLAAIKRPDTEIKIATLPSDIYSGGLPEKTVRFGAVEVLYAQYFAAGALLAQASGYDAYIIATSQDPGLEDARTLASIPVIGYSDSMLRLGATLKHTIGVVGFIAELEEPIRANARRKGLEHLLAGFAYLDDAGLVTDALTGHPEEFLSAFSMKARAVIDRGATAIMPGEGIPSEILVSNGVTEIDGVPVIDCNGVMLKFAEFFVDMAMLQITRVATGGYFGRRPEVSTLTHMSSILYADLAAHWPREGTQQ